jgi:antitoxin (DNA-binding transcriptional repressor) of toxin-antitoxin stability system
MEDQSQCAIVGAEMMRVGPSREEGAVSTKIVDINEARGQLPELIDLVQAGNEVIIAIDAQPLARLMPMNGIGQKKRIAGLNRGQIWMSEDFDAPLPDEFWLGEE